MEKSFNCEDYQYRERENLERFHIEVFLFGCVVFFGVIMMISGTVWFSLLTFVAPGVLGILISFYIYIRQPIKVKYRYIEYDVLVDLNAAYDNEFLYHTIERIFQYKKEGRLGSHKK